MPAFEWLVPRTGEVEIEIKSGEYGVPEGRGGGGVVEVGVVLMYWSDSLCVCTHAKAMQRVLRRCVFSHKQPKWQKRANSSISEASAREYYCNVLPG